MTETRQPVGQRLALDIDGVRVDSLRRFEGVQLQGDVVDTPGAGGMSNKHPGNISWTPGKASVGLDMGEAMYHWVKSAFEQGSVTRSGVLTATDINFAAEALLTFTDALITEVTVPKLDASSKDLGFLDIAFQPELVQWSRGDGKEIRGNIGSKQKAWASSNFRIELGSLPCHRVTSIESFTWKCTAVDRGRPRDPSQRVAQVTVPDLRLTISNADIEPWSHAARTWLVDGKNLDGDEMEGRIAFLSPDLSRELGSIELHHVGFKSFSPLPQSAREGAATFNVELYVEKMNFSLTQYR